LEVIQRNQQTTGVPCGILCNELCTFGTNVPLAPHLGTGSGSRAEQTGKVMMAYEKLLNEASPDLDIWKPGMECMLETGHVIIFPHYTHINHLTKKLFGWVNLSEYRSD